MKENGLGNLALTDKNMLLNVEEDERHHENLVITGKREKFQEVTKIGFNKGTRAPKLYKTQHTMILLLQKYLSRRTNGTVRK